ncbi:hypothetical protein, partial [Duncaniella muris]|uniref:hypothetical protein n=1 Tax=Duncaniella muris TaxID=2094150 RepID=UPI00271547CF
MPELLPFCYGLLNNHRGLLKSIYDGVVFLTLGIEDTVVFLLQSLHQFLLIVAQAESTVHMLNWAIRSV